MIDGPDRHEKVRRGGSTREVSRAPAASAADRRQPLSRAVAFLEAHVGPVAAGEDILRPIVNDFIDLALRFAHLPDSTPIAIRVGEVRRVVAASPRYLAQNPVVKQPADLAKHQIAAMTHFGSDSWSFPPLEGSLAPRAVQFTPRLIINGIKGAVASAVAGSGVTRVFSYHIADQLRDGSLQILPAGDEHAPLPVHRISPQGRTGAEVPRLRGQFAKLSREANPGGRAIHSGSGRVSVE
jgi:DNA-binding transcriptional LysR family regulator